jgi:hypothetical protein
MKTLSKLSFVVLVASAAMAGGCAADRMGGDPGPGGDDDPTDDPTPPPPPREIDATGSYRIHSRFDIAANMPGAAGTVVNELIEATDDPTDPMSWVLGKLIAAMPDGFLKDALTAVEPFVAGELNDELIELAPGLVNTLLDVGQGVEDVAKNFGLSEQLDVTTGVDGEYSGKMTVDGVELTIANTQHAFAFTAYGMENVVVPGVPVTYDATQSFGIGQHLIPLSYGKILRIAVDEAIVPLIDPSAQDLGDLLNNMVDCAAVGQQVASAVGFGSASTWQGFCITGLDLAADQIYDQIVGIDSSLLDFDLSGRARGADTNADYFVDKLEGGTWAGTLTYSGTAAPLGTSTFTGFRL